MWGSPDDSSRAGRMIDPPPGSKRQLILPPCPRTGFRHHQEPLRAKMRAQVQTIWDSRPLIGNFAQRELKARYRRSILGWAWSMINPLATIAIYTLVFGVIFKAEPPVAGNGSTRSFALYLFTGLVTWNLFFTMVMGPMDWLAGVADLLKKVQFPPDAAIFGGTLSGVVQSLIEAGVLLVIMIGIGNVGWTYLLLPYVLATTLLFGLGIGFVLAIANAHFRDIKHLTGIALNVWFFLTPIVYPPSLFPEEYAGLPAAKLVHLNPMFQYVEATRDSVYVLSWSGGLRLLSLGLMAAVSFVVGWTFFVRHSVDISEEL